jgi:hypothetical protein
MAARLRHDPHTQLPHGRMEPAQNWTSACVAAWQQQKWCQEQENEWEDHLQSLQQCMRELLIKNQQLRVSLTSATQYRNRELTIECDRHAAGNRS